MIFIKTHKELETYLMDSKAVGIKESYFIIESENQCIYVINPGLNGIEFNKTEGYFREDDSVGIYQCLYGQGILIMQRNSFLLPLHLTLFRDVQNIRLFH